ncbi:MAG TPA: hypothetical protein VGY31_06505 [Terriglobia bacterium]|nr:hypothetical protein [Terriglobia bacterium]
MTGCAAGVDSWTILNTLGTVAAASAALIGLVFVVYQLRQNSRTLQLQVLEGIFRDIRELDEKWIEKNFSAEMREEEKKAWCATFFNTVEYFCFLINRKIVRQKELRDFFIVGLRHWWKQFEEYRIKGLIIDTSDSFEEFKRLCKEEGIANQQKS